MNRQAGISTVGIALVVMVLAAGGGGFFAWQKHQELGHTKSELASTKGALDKAVADVRTAKADAASARKELEDQKAALAQARVDAESAKAFLQSEKSHAARLQGELVLAREQIAYMRARSPAAYTQPSQPSIVQQRPMVIQAIPAPRPQGATPMQGAPAQGYGRLPPQ